LFESIDISIYFKNYDFVVMEGKTNKN